MPSNEELLAAAGHFTESAGISSNPYHYFDNLAANALRTLADEVKRRKEGKS